MFNFSESYPIVDIKPSAGLLSPNAYRTIQAGWTYTGDPLEVIDIDSITKSTGWTRGETRKEETYNQYYALMNAMMVEEGGITGVANWLGFSDEPLKGAYIRQLMGKEPLKPWKYGEADLTEQALDQDRKALNKLVEYKTKQPTAGQPDEIDDRIKELTAKLTYAEADKKAAKKLGFNLWDLIDASNMFWGYGPLDLMFGDKELAGNTEDIEKRLSAYDPNFKPDVWFNEKFKDETAMLGLAENGISVETIRNSPNADHAMYRIMTMLSRTDFQRRLETYTPSFADKGRLLRDVLVGGILNNPGEVGIGVSAELGVAALGTALGAIAGTAVTPVAGTAAGAIGGGAVALGAFNAITPAGSIFLRLKRVYDSSTTVGKTLRGLNYATETLYKMPLGVMPSYASNFGLIRGTAASFGFGVIQGSAAEIARQQREIAFAASTLYANPYAQADYDLSLIATGGLEGGALFGGVFGLGLGSLRTGFGAMRNRISGVVIDPTTGMRDITDRRWSLEGTPLGRSIDNFRGKYSKPIIDTTVQENLAKEAVLNKEGVTPEKLASETEARVNRAETREAMGSAERARAVPEDSGTRRYVNETIPDYLARVAPHRVVRNITEFLSSVARRTVRGTDSKLLPEDLDFASLNTADQLRVVLDAGKHLEEAKRIETEAVGLPKERETVYRQMEAQRKQYATNLKKKLSDLEYKSIVDEWKGVSRRSTDPLPKLIADARDTTKPVAERQVAAKNAALQVLEAAREAATNKDNAELVRNSLPEDVRRSVDVAILEQQLNDGIISESTVQGINVAVTKGTLTKPATKTKLTKAIERATLLARVDPERMAKIKAVVQNPEKFVDIVSGNKQNAQAFYDFVTKGVNDGILNEQYRLILLTSVVHLNFNSTAWNTTYRFYNFDGKPLAGDYDIVSRTLRINPDPVLLAKDPAKKVEKMQAMVKTVLHELGHAYFSNELTGRSFGELLKVFNNLHYSDKLNYLTLRSETSADEFLNGFYSKVYIMQNVEEFAVESWARIMLSETTEVIKELNPIQISFFDSVLDKIASGVVLATDVLNNSDSYYAAKKLLDEVFLVGDNLNQEKSFRRSYQNYIEAFKESKRKSWDRTIEAQNKEWQQLIDQGMLPEQIKLTTPDFILSASDFNAYLRGRGYARDSRLLVTQQELDLLTTNQTQDNLLALLAAKSFSDSPIISSDGLGTNFFKYVEVLEDFKKAQIANANLKLAAVLSSPDYAIIKSWTKKERRTFFKVLLNPSEAGILLSERNVGSKSFVKRLESISLPVAYLPEANNLLQYSNNKNLITYLETLKQTITDPAKLKEINTAINNVSGNMWLTKNNLELIRLYLNSAGLLDIAENLVSIEHQEFLKSFVTKRKTGTTLFSIVDESDMPQWSTPESALSNLGWMLEAKLTTDQIETLISRNVSPALVRALANKFKTPTQLVNGINAVISSGQVVFNTTTKLWELPTKPTKQKKTTGKKATKETPQETPEPEKKKLVKGKAPRPVSDPQVVRNAEDEALKTNSVAVTLENLKDMLVRMANEKLGNQESVNTLFINPAAAENRIDSGEIKTLTDLIKYTHGMNRKAEAKAKRKAAILKKLVEQGVIRVSETEKPVVTLARESLSTITEAEKRLTIFEQFLEYNKQLGNILFSEDEAKLLDQMIRFTTNEELAKELGVSIRTAGNRRSALTKKIMVIVKESGIDPADTSEFVTNALKDYQAKLQRTVDSVTKPGKEVEKTLTTENTEPVNITAKEDAAQKQAAKKLLLDMAQAEKLKNTNPDPVTVVTETPVVPVTTTAIVLYRAISEVTGNVPPPELRPEVQADALIQGSNRATKEAVEFKPNKPFNMKKKHSEMLPDELEKLKTSLAGFGNDAIVFTDGVVVPLDSAPAPKVIGKTEIDVLPDQPKEGAIVKEGGVSTTKIYVKKPRTVKEDDAPRVLKPSTTEATDTVVMPVERTETDAVKTTEGERLERRTNADIPLLRSNGMDSNFLVQFMKKYWESKVEVEGPTTLTDGFKYMWTQFVLVNQFIADSNRAILGENVMTKFWAAVDRISLYESKLQKVLEGPSGRKPLTYFQVLQKAAQEVSEPGKDFVMPMLPGEAKFIKTDAAGNYRLSARTKKYQAIVRSAGEDIPVPPPKAEGAPVETTVPTPVKKTSIPPAKKPPTLDESLGSVIRESEDASSVLLRQNNLVGRIMGGNERSMRSWWERLMNWTTATTTGATQMANTIKSHFAPISFVARLFDDTRTQTATLVSAGKEARATAMHFRSEEGRLIVSVVREWAKLTAMLPRMSPNNKREIDMVLYRALYSNKTVTSADLSKLGVPGFKAEAVAKQANEIIKRARYANKAILDLEGETRRIISVDSEGNPIDSNFFAPTQVDHEGLQNLNAVQFEQLIKDLVSARTKRKLNSKTLDRNTIIAMGWLDVRSNPADKTFSLFVPDRSFRASDGVNMFSVDTLNKLRIGAIASTGIEGDASKVFKLMGIADPENYFVMKTDTGFDVFRVPKKIEDLDVNDALKYREAVSGNTAMYTEQWRQRLGGKNLIDKEIRELIKQKTRQFPYNTANQPDSIFKQAFFRLSSEGSDENIALPIKGLIPEEFMETDLTRSVIRTNLAEAYFYFLKGRYFELAFQKQLNKMLGRTDLTIDDVLNYAQEKAVNGVDKIAESQKWPVEEITRVKQNIGSGIQRLREEHQFNADTLPFLTTEASNSARVALAIMKFKLSPGFGISALVETVNEVIKQSPNVFSVPKNIINALRFIMLDKRFSKNKLLQSEIGDMMFVLESFRTDLSNRFMGEVGYGAFQADSRLRTRMAGAIGNIRRSGEFSEGAIRTVEEAGKLMQSVGSLQAVTNATRALAKTRIQGLIWKYVGSDKFGRLLDTLTQPQVADELAKLQKAATTSAEAERQLWTRFAGLARQSGITDANEAATLLKYGITTKEQIRHLVWAMNKVGHRDGKLDMILLSEVRNDLLDNPVKGIDPDTLSSVVSAYAFMVEDMITKTAVSELRGLNKITNVDARSPFGRLWYSLTSWVRSFQDNVIMDFGSRSTAKYLVSGIFLYMVTETMIGLFKEWLAGREMEDIVEEMSDNPTQFFLRGIGRMPFFGIYNGILEAGVGGVSAATGGTFQYFGTPGMPAGIMAGISSIEKTKDNAFNIAESAWSNEGWEKVDIKSISMLFGAESLINRSPLAVPARTLETNNAFREMEAIQRYLEIVHRKPYPYMNRSMTTPTVSTKPVAFDERNLLLEAQEALQQRQVMEERKKQIPPGGGVDMQGVSGILGDILEGNR